MQNEVAQQTHSDDTRTPLVFTFHDIDASMLLQVGGKAANLGELTRAGLPVPPGFCVTSEAYTRATSGAELEPLLNQLASTRADDSAQLEHCAAAIRSRLLAVSMPNDIVEAITRAYHVLAPDKPIPVAVRSSATAEDLPFASFAGQQDTYLNIVGIEAVLDAVQRCWASLWTDRAVSYRASLAPTQQRYVAPPSNAMLAPLRSAQHTLPTPSTDAINRAALPGADEAPTFRSTYAPNPIDPRTVRLAVIVQRMVEAAVAGVLFTANPLSGRRRQAVIDANPGLGEAVVSGAVNPDHFVVNAESGEIVERHLGDKRVVIRSTPGGGTQRIEMAAQDNTACLTDEQVRALARLGVQVEAHYGAPQDTEWAIDSDGQLWLTQARPITTLYPLPTGAPTTDQDLRVYFSINVLQGVYRPLTPMGISAFRLVTASAATLLGFPPRDPQQGAGAFAVAASRIFLDVTPALRHSLGRAFIIGVLGRFAEARSVDLFEQAVTDPRLSIVSTSRRPAIHIVLHVLFKRRALLYLSQAILNPSAARARVARLEAKVRTLGEVPADASATEHLAAYERLLSSEAVPLLLSVAPAIPAGLGGYGLAGRLLKDLATPDELQKVIRGLPDNPTTEMDLALWALAQQARADPDAAQCLHEKAPQQLVQDYREGKLPPTLQQGLADFLRTYGHRGVAEIDLGLPRWSEDPTYLLGALANYLQLTDPATAPDVQFQHSVEEAEAMVAELTRRATRKSRWLGMRVKFCLKSTRAFVGWREKPKYYAVLLLARARRLLWSVGEALARTGQVETAEDIFFLTPQEARVALDGGDMRGTVRERRADYEQELKRRHIPRVLLSDGTEPTAETHSSGTDHETLQGAPASAGVVTAKARVIMDPVGARLEPGEILVAPSTDPGWTPLFLTAGGLVMEMGGSMSHGAVVAREYGIPAVVGVPGATERIATGQRITVDGSSGVIVIEPEEHEG